MSLNAQLYYILFGFGNLNKHYENKFTKKFRPTNILHIITKFYFGVFRIEILFVTNQLNINKFLPLQRRKILISYNL